MSIDTTILRRELDSGDAKTAQLYDALSALRESQVKDAAGLAVLQALSLAPNEFESRLQREQYWCEQSKDTLALLVVSFDEALSMEEDARVIVQLLELANNPGDFVGRTREGAHAVALASVTENQAARLLNVAVGMATYAAPDRDFRCGYQCLKSTAPRPPIALQSAPNRTRYASDVTLARTR